MNNIRVAVVLITGLFFFALIPQHSQAQKAGAGLSYGNKLNMIGGQIDGTYRFYRLFRVAGNVSVFFPKEADNGTDEWGWWSVNLNGHIIFLEKGRFRTYALTGVNYATIQIQSPNTGTNSVDSQIGINAGGGVEYSLSFGDLYGESKYVFIDDRYQQTTVQVGFRFYLGSSY